MVAAGKGRMEDVMALLSSGADPQQTASDGSSPIDWARRFGHEELATFLEEHSAVRLIFLGLRGCQTRNSSLLRCGVKKKE